MRFPNFYHDDTIPLNVEDRGPEELRPLIDKLLPHLVVRRTQEYRVLINYGGEFASDLFWPEDDDVQRDQYIDITFVGGLTVTPTGEKYPNGRPIYRYQQGAIVTIYRLSIEENQGSVVGHHGRYLREDDSRQLNGGR